MDGFYTNAVSLKDKTLCFFGTHESLLNWARAAKDVLTLVLPKGFKATIKIK